MNGKDIKKHNNNSVVNLLSQDMEDAELLSIATPIAVEEIGLFPTHLQERLSYHYVSAIAARAGMTVSKPEPDYGIDLHLQAVVQLNNGRYIPDGPILSVQLKSSTNCRITDDFVTYSLDARTYDLLTKDHTNFAPLLFVLSMPDKQEEWIDCKDGHLKLRDYCYWCEISPGLNSDSKASVTVQIPRSNHLTPDALRAIVVERKTKQKADYGGR